MLNDTTTGLAVIVMVAALAMIVALLAHATRSALSAQRKHTGRPVFTAPVVWGVLHRRSF